MKNVFVFIVFMVSLQHITFGYNLNEDYNFSDYAQQYVNSQASQRNIQKKQDETFKLKEDYTLIDNWPSSSKKLGAISAVALDVYKNVVVFHRVNRVWNAASFDLQNNFQQRNLGPISENTIITFDRETGNILEEWGKNIFYMPHGLHINGNYYYITDVALHQVFRFNLKKSKEQAELVLGDAFKPGRNNQFCKPTSVASLEENGDFFVADGYCNSRIIKYSFNGQKLLEWGKNSFQGYNVNPELPNFFAIPHALTLVPDKNLLCVADRENGRVQCFYTKDGKFHSQYHSSIVGERLFSVDYANNTLFVVNGPESQDQKKAKEVAGYGFDMSTGEVSLKFGKFLDPHDIAVTLDGREIYVGDLSENNGHRLYKFILNGRKPTITHEGDSAISRVKPITRRGETLLIVGSIVLLFAIFTTGMAILITKRKRRGNEEQYTLMQK